MNNKFKITLNFFLLFLISFLLASLIWRFFIRNIAFINVTTNSLSILGIYYILASVVFVVMKIRNVTLKDI